jgi:hypothetical protein
MTTSWPKVYFIVDPARGPGYRETGREVGILTGWISHGCPYH